MNHQLKSQASNQRKSGPQMAAPAGFVQAGGNAAWAERLTADGAVESRPHGEGRARLEQAGLQGSGGLRWASDAGGELLNRILGRGTGDIEREGTLTAPQTGDAVDVDEALAEAAESGHRPGEWLMERYAFQPSGERTTDPEDRTLRIFAPGLNTPEPEASRRTQVYADRLGQPMVHLHNGTNLDAGIPGSDMLDYAAAAGTRAGIKDTALMQSMRTLLTAALGQAEPEDVHAILYSDSTIGGTRAIAQVREQLIRERQAKGSATAEAEVDALLDEHLFVELHGNAAADLPVGPRYAVWTANQDGFTHNRPLPFLPELGFSGSQKDADANAMYLDYDSPFVGGDAHNLAAIGVSAVRETWAANGVNSTQALFEQFQSGASIAIPEGIQGDASELWDPATAYPERK